MKKVIIIIGGIGIVNLIIFLIHIGIITYNEQKIKDIENMFTNYRVYKEKEFKISYDKDYIPKEWLNYKIDKSFFTKELIAEYELSNNVNILLNSLENGDEIWAYSSNYSVWTRDYGKAGLCIVRNNKIIAGIVLNKKTYIGM